MLKSRPVVLDFEGFRHKKCGFIIKELAVSTENYCEGNRKNRKSSETSQEGRYQFRDFIMSKI